MNCGDVSDPGPRLLAHLDSHHHHVLCLRTLVTTLEGSFCCPSATHLPHGHRTMGLQAITSKGLARWHQEGARCALTRLRGMDFASSLLGLSLASPHTPILQVSTSGRSRWSPAWTSVGRTSWKGLATEDGIVCPETGGGLGKLGLPSLSFFLCF